MQSTMITLPTLLLFLLSLLLLLFLLLSLASSALSKLSFFFLITSDLNRHFGASSASLRIEDRAFTQPLCSQAIHIAHVVWRVTAWHERCDSHRSSQHSTIVGLAHRTSCKLHPSALLTLSCLPTEALSCAKTSKPNSSRSVFCPMITKSPSPGSTINGMVNQTGPHALST